MPQLAQILVSTLKNFPGGGGGGGGGGGEVGVKDVPQTPPSPQRNFPFFFH